MVPYETAAISISNPPATSSSSTTTTTISKPPEIDGLLARARYKVHSSDLRHVAQRLEIAMLNSPSQHLSLLASDAVLYNPSDLSTWGTADWISRDGRVKARR
ncbi:unnamed protein product [Linum trigynum]|uniref:Transcriptional factor DELLA N-terminal domain-containing protein n=1 Tax=Linum trigynum TaxID=586398 RepID=A0AAV2GRL7_9ROSI